MNIYLYSRTILYMLKSKVLKGVKSVKYNRIKET